MPEPGDAPCKRARGFAPIASPDARILILGSLPGAESLRQRRYYAHPRNAFWPIMAELLGFDAADVYAMRAAALRGAGIALWDVCHSARRPGSLDSNIDVSNVSSNDFARFFMKHSCIQLVCFNGTKAAELYRRLVAPQLPSSRTAPRTELLPSTSPAHATLDYKQKLGRWSRVLAGAAPPRLTICKQRNYPG